MIWPRLLLALPLLAAPIWAGAAGRSLWLLPVLIGVFTIAFIDGKNRIWRENFAKSGAAEQASSVAGAALSQTILVSLLFFTAAGVSLALGAIGERAAFDRLDASVAAGVLAISLLGGAIVRWADGGRDPVDRALESLATTLEEIEQDADQDLPPEDEFDLLEQLDAELKAVAERFLVSEAEIDSLASRYVEADSPLGAASHLTHLARNPDPETDIRIGAGNRLRVVYRAMRGLWETASGEISDIYAASFEALIFSTLANGEAPLRLEALRLAETMALRGDRLTALLQAIEKEPGLEEESGRALKSRAALLLQRLETT